MKKVLSVILSVLLVASAFAFSVSAEDFFYEITYGEAAEINVPSVFETEDYVYVKFVPEADGRYIFKVYAEDPYNADCDIFDEELQSLEQEVTYNTDDECSSCATCFTAGVTYYFAVFNYGEGTQPFTMKIECAHIFADGVCETCGFVCDHSTAYEMGSCLCGEKFLGTVLETGVSYTLDMAANNNESYWCSFTPEETGAYTIKTTDAEYSMCYLHNADGEYLGCYDDYSNVEKVHYKDCIMIYGLEAGQTYYYELSCAQENSVFEVEINKATHTTLLNKVHYVEYVFETYSTCNEHGYSDGIYCPDCDKYLWGHEEYELEDHYDYEDDGICDDCGANISESDGENSGDENEGGVKGFFEKFIQGVKKLWAFILNLFARLFA